MTQNNMFSIEINKNYLFQYSSIRIELSKSRNIYMNTRFRTYKQLTQTITKIGLYVRTLVQWMEINNTEIYIAKKHTQYYIWSTVLYCVKLCNTITKHLWTLYYAYTVQSTYIHTSQFPTFTNTSKNYLSIFFVARQQ